MHYKCCQTLLQISMTWREEGFTTKRGNTDSKSDPVQINQVKAEFSLQNSSHGLAFTVTFPSIKHNTDIT